MSNKTILTAEHSQGASAVDPRFFASFCAAGFLLILEFKFFANHGSSICCMAANLPSGADLKYIGLDRIQVL